MLPNYLLHSGALRNARALSVRQPWCYTILSHGLNAKRIENRVKWTTRYPAAGFRGWCFLHASAGMSKQEYADVLDFMRERRITGIDLPPMEQVIRGGIVGVMRVVGIVHPKDRMVVIDNVQRHLTPMEHLWWMGEFALVLADVQATRFVPIRGALGFWSVPEKAARLALGA